MIYEVVKSGNSQEFIEFIAKSENLLFVRNPVTLDAILISVGSEFSRFSEKQAKAICDLMNSAEFNSDRA